MVWRGVGSGFNGQISPSIHPSALMGPGMREGQNPYDVIISFLKRGRKEVRKRSQEGDLVFR